MADQAMEHEKSAADQAPEKKPAAEAQAGKPLGNFLLTHYTFALESDPIHAKSPLVSAKGLPPDKKYRESFLGSPYGIKMQGTGLAEDGKYIQYAGNDTYKYGVGGAGGAPVAWKSCAVDTSVIPMHSNLEIEAYKDKGTFEAKDTGGAIKGKHIDIFAGAIPIAQAYALGTKHSDVFLLGAAKAAPAPAPAAAGGGDHKAPAGGGEHAAKGGAGGKQEASAGGGAKAPAKGGPQQYKEGPSLADVASGKATVQRGMKGEAVAFVQINIHVSVDGEFGPATEAALKVFQRQQGLEVDGVVGVHTLKALESPKKPGKDAGQKDAGKAKGDPGKGNGTGGTAAPVAGKTGGGTDAGKHEPAPAGGGAEHEEPVSGGSPVSIARKFVRSPPLRADSPVLKKGLPHYTAAGGATNDCADFVSSVLMTAGRISQHEINVTVMKNHLLGSGWREVPKEKSQAGDVWLNDTVISHVTLVSQAGGGTIIGANGSSVEYITEEGINYKDSIWLHKD